MRARLLLIGAALVAFGGSLGSGFHFDDYGIFSDAALIAPAGWKAVWTLARTRPLTDLTYWLNYQVGGQDPLGYHLLNLLLHIGAVLLAFAVLKRMVPEGAAAMGAAIFAVHPLQAEAVDYVWGRGVVLAGLLCLLSLLAWLEGRRWVAVPCFALALLASPEVAAFPLAPLLFHRKHRVELGALIALAAAAAGRVLYTAGHAAGPSLLAQGLAVARCLRLLVVPYGFTIDPDIRAPAVWAGILVWASLFALTWIAWQRRWLWLLAGLILLLPGALLFPGPDVAGGRRAYLALVAFGAAAGLLLARVKTPLPGAAVAAVLLLVSVSRTIVWNNDEALWREAVRRAPEKVRPKVELARHLRAAEALELLGSARRIAPQDPRISAEVGRILLSQGRPADALEEFAHALAADPHDPRNYNNRGAALAILGQTEAARSDFERALQMEPNFQEARENLRKITGPPAP